MEGGGGNRLAPTPLYLSLSAFRLPPAALRVGSVCLAVAVLSLWCGNAKAELQWRRGRPPGQAASQPAQHTNASVQPVAYNEGQEPVGRATLRSVIVDRGDQRDSLRSAQLPFPEADSRYEQQLREPFAGTPDEDESEFDSQFDETKPMQAPDGDILPGTEERQPSPSLESSPSDQMPPPATFSQPPTGQPMGVDPFESETPGDNFALGATSKEDEAQRAQEFCFKEFERMTGSTLHDVRLDIGVAGTAGTDFPYECSIDDGRPYPDRCWPQTTYLWKASALCHKPLYFENESLERYGHSWGPYVQPLVSGAHFFSRLPILPYEMGLEPPNECIYALGHYRPGSCAPYMIDPIPFTFRAALFEAGAVVGAAAVIP